MMRYFLVSFLFVVINTVVTAQISPGKLSSAHSKLEGISNCTKCHVLRSKVENKKCLDCHKEIKSLIQKKLGFHSSADVNGKDCIKCHGEHFGRDFNLLNFKPDDFDHNRKTTFQLTGKHAELKCNKCHQKKFINSVELKKNSKTYLGLSTNCTSCHKDYHQGTLKKQKCTACHNTVTWKSPVFFNHDKTKFKLDGAHQEVKCEKCHKKLKLNGKDFQKFADIKFAKCTNCHTDLHKGKFGNDCLKCHTKLSFSKVKNLKNFDHFKTSFPLEGKHGKVACSKCHINGFKKKLKFRFCDDCHEDKHSGQLIQKNGKIENCSSCHNVYGFVPSTFSVEDHQKTNFSLAGSHLAIPCSACHLKDDKTDFKFKNYNCETCHENIHGKEIEKFSLNNNRCITCHVVTGWDSIKFDHNKTNFSLLGKHKNVKCSKCHFEKNKSKIFIKISAECSKCHEDFHNGQFKRDFANRCSTCHGFENWKPTKFDHNKTRFKLAGAHAKVECSQCHTHTIIKGKKQIQFKFEDISCESCHK